MLRWLTSAYSVRQTPCRVMVHCHPRFQELTNTVLNFSSARTFGSLVFNPPPQKKLPNKNHVFTEIYVNPAIMKIARLILPSTFPNNPKSIYQASVHIDSRLT